jgi:hypothetical protein
MNDERYDLRCIDTPGRRVDVREDVGSGSCGQTDPEARRFGPWWPNLVTALLISGVIAKEGTRQFISEAFLASSP